MLRPQLVGVPRAESSPCQKEKGLFKSADADAPFESLSQAVLNLLSNAVKYSGGDRRIALRVYRKGDDVAVSVSDRGIGIPKEEQAHIFQKFYRVNSTVAAQRSGAGLGLALVKHFAQAHGGSVNVESEPGRGSTFTILLPCVAEKPVNVHV